MRLRIQVAHLLAAACLLASHGSALPSEADFGVPKEVSDLVGAYSGSWKTFGIDADGKVVERSAWKDTMKADNPIRDAERAWVSTEDVMTFDGRTDGPFKLSGKEGYRLNADGSLGDYFIETFGQTYQMQKLAEGIWTYATEALPQELTQLGFPRNAT